MKKIVLTGGGTAGHVTPNIALLPRLKELQYDIHYIGSYNGIEKELISQFGIPYHGISTGKLRRYFSVQNFTDPFRVIKGMGEARKLIKILEPVVKPSMVTVGLLAFLEAWNNFMIPLYLSSSSNATLPLALVNMRQQTMGVIDYGATEAGVVILMIPAAILFLALQKYYVKGFMAGAVKG